MNWAKSWDYKFPDPKTSTTADYMLASTVFRDLQNADQNFLKGDMGPQYANPRAYRSNMVHAAIELTKNVFAVPYAPLSWDAVSAGLDIADSAFEMLKRLPVNAGDENSASVYDAWVSGKGALYGGHELISGIPGKTGDGVNAETGPGSVSGGTIFGGSK